MVGEEGILPKRVAVGRPGKKEAPRRQPVAHPLAHHPVVGGTIVESHSGRQEGRSRPTYKPRIVEMRMGVKAGGRHEGPHVPGKQVGVTK